MAKTLFFTHCLFQKKIRMRRKQPTNFQLIPLWLIVFWFPAVSDDYSDRPIVMFITACPISSNQHLCASDGSRGWEGERSVVNIVAVHLKNNILIKSDSPSVQTLHVFLIVFYFLLSSHSIQRIIINMSFLMI